MSGGQYLGTMDEWMRSQEKRMTSVERRKRRASAGGGGEPGPVGPAGPPGLIWRGTWSAATAYAAADAVAYAGSNGVISSYIAVQAGVNQPPSEGASNAYWQLLAQEGQAGPAGPAGPGGADGVGIAADTIRGEWNPATAYIEDDVVQRHGATWAALGPNTGVDPELPVPVSAVGAAASAAGYQNLGSWGRQPFTTNATITLHEIQVTAVGGGFPAGTQIGLVPGSWNGTGTWPWITGAVYTVPALTTGTVTATLPAPITLAAGSYQVAINHTLIGIKAAPATVSGVVSAAGGLYYGGGDLTTTLPTYFIPFALRGFTAGGGARWVLLAAAATAGGVPTGALTPFAGVNAPAGWLLANGVGVSRTVYAALFAVIGTTYGVGDNVTTFNVPDLRGRVAMGVAGSYPMASTGGEATHVLTAAEMPVHDHTVRLAVDTGGVVNNLWNPAATAQTFSILKNGPYGASGGGAGAGLSGDAGSGASHNNLQPYTVLNYIIKY